VRVVEEIGNISPAGSLKIELTLCRLFTCKAFFVSGTTLVKHGPRIVNQISNLPVGKYKIVNEKIVADKLKIKLNRFE